MKKALLLVLFLLLFGTNVHSETIVFEGIPTMTSSSSPEEAFNKPVEGEDRNSYKCIITKEGEDYIWFSREKKKLNHIKSGAFYYFLEPNGAGYIKITKLDNGKYMYMESMSMVFKIITYWGIADKLELR